MNRRALNLVEQGFHSSRKRAMKVDVRLAHHLVRAGWRGRLSRMNKPIQPAPVVVTLSPDDATDLEARVERGEFASLDEAVAAELAELNYRRAAEIMGGSEKLERFLDELEAETVDPKDYLDAESVFAELSADLKSRLDASQN